MSRCCLYTLLQLRTTSMVSLQSLYKLWFGVPFSTKTLAWKEITPLQDTKTTCADLSHHVAHGQTLQSKPGRVAKWVSISEQGLYLALDTQHQ